MVQSGFVFSNLIGTVYRQGNLCFTQDGNSVISPVGNRVTVLDLVNDRSRTLRFENSKNIACIALSPDGNVLLSIDMDGYCLMVNFKRGVVLHRFNFKQPVRDVAFSPDGRFILVTHGHQTQVWRTPSHLAREFAPFVLHRTYTGHYDDVLSVQWSPDSKCFLTTSKDMTAKLYTIDPIEGYRPKTFAGHRDHVLHAYFSQDGNTIYTIARDGVVFTWRAKEQDEDDSESEDERMRGLEAIPSTRWGLSDRHYFHQAGSRITSLTFHSPSSMLIVGFASGVFGLWLMPAFENIHTLSISQEKITSVVVNPSGEWLAFGASKLGQLLVWEWQSESYVLKQQGHFYDMNCLTFSSDGQNIVTGGEDGKVKVWNASTGFCFVTFSEHSSAVSAVEFSKQGQVLFSASLDGTVRAFDLVRYRNFRTFTSPSPVQFSCLAIDPSGDIVCAAGSGDDFEICVWSTQTGKILDILTGHEGPICGLAFSPTGDRLASCSWDGTARLWDLYGRSSAVEPFELGSDGLAIAFRPDGKEICVSTLDGQIVVWDVVNGRQTSVIDGRRDIAGGRRLDQQRTAANSTSGKCFTSLAYTADGANVIAGGNSKHVCLYDLRESVLLKRWEISRNLSLDGTQELLDSRKLTEAGHIDTIDERGDLSDLEDRLDKTLPGARGGDASRRKYKPEARTKCVRFSPTGRSWGAASTEGLLVYSLDDQQATFDPFDLEIDITPETIAETLAAREYLKATIMAFRLNEHAVIKSVYDQIPPDDVKIIARTLPAVYTEALLRFLATELEQAPRLEYNLRWAEAVLSARGSYLRTRSGESAATLRALQKSLSACQTSIAQLCDANTFDLEYIIDQVARQSVVV
ncbi:uncharacterized protein L969DRAFT_53454 [Mixia osmundae IAM 14324]|uniref:Small-subunit processome Utp12 domain-containing protein n=1 Tax=Mixia osmundae (strain CBS 9802 / IAM 14324 / JCM 22182 / KY 12970) TaxID=764103 RepID=G7DSV1_MIXOS|nr:uncharacterized protein L969DRAFT_53454 [Mixia osmundae IAM 14324]KEI37117.1 hypothetical protein L969DRAFT_53454 [Mixia osmundae IAM 14324]GAA93661.1 hypothetical protein E5Q_00306 [Mixia osmundae IAM 14324]